MAKLIHASCVALCVLFAARAAQAQQCKAGREGELFLEWTDGTPRGVRLAPTGDAWRLNRLPDGIYQFHCPGCGEGKGVSAWLAVRLRDTSASNSGRLWISDIVVDLLSHQLEVMGFANIVKAGPATVTLFGLDGHTITLEVWLRDRRAMNITIMTAAEGCFTLHVILFSNSGEEVPEAVSNSFAAALAVERYQPGIDPR